VSNFLFYAAGIEFSLLVGNGIPDEESKRSFSENPGRPIILVDVSPMLRDITVDVMKTAPKVRNIQKFLKKS
jgi:hypothetical protein